MASGRLIVFEGPDGIGKSSLVNEVCTRLLESTPAIRQLSFPGNTPGSLGALVYGLHHEPSQYGIDKISSAALQALHIAAHLDSIQNSILPALESGTVVLLDRFWWSTWVYGIAANVGRAILDSLIRAEKALWKDRMPDAVFLITHSQAFRPEHPQEEFDRHLQLYMELSAQEGQQYPVFLIENTEFKPTVDSILHILSGKPEQPSPCGPHRYDSANSVIAASDSVRGPR